VNKGNFQNSFEEYNSKVPEILNLCLNFRESIRMWLNMCAYPYFFFLEMPFVVAVHAQWIANRLDLVETKVP